MPPLGCLTDPPQLSRVGVRVASVRPAGRGDCRETFRASADPSQFRQTLGRQEGTDIIHPLTARERPLAQANVDAHEFLSSRLIADLQYSLRSLCGNAKRSPRCLRPAAVSTMFDVMVSDLQLGSGVQGLRLLLQSCRCLCPQTPPAAFGKGAAASQEGTRPSGLPCVLGGLAPGSAERQSAKRSHRRCSAERNTPSGAWCSPHAPACGPRVADRQKRGVRLPVRVRTQTGGVNDAPARGAGSETPPRSHRYSGPGWCPGAMAMGRTVMETG